MKNSTTSILICLQVLVMVKGLFAGSSEIDKERVELMKYYLDDKEITLEELEEARKNLVCADAAEEVIELLKIEPDAMYFTIKIGRAHV